MDHASLTTQPEGLPELLLQVLREQKAFLPDGSRTPLHSNISLSEAETLYRAVREIRPQASLEIGLAQGISTLSILKALADNRAGIHYVADPFQEKFYNVGLAHAQRAGLNERLVYHQKFAEEMIPALPPVQFAFIDASHLFDLTLMEFVLADKKLEVGGIVGLHDMWMPSLQKVLRYILSTRSYVVVNEFDAKNTAETSRSILKTAARKFLASLPRSERIFRKDFLQPWSEMNIPNMALLRKTAHDAREWKHYVDF